MKDFTQIAIYLKKNVKEGDLVITLGAGDVNKIARMISVM
jgi:UDP-N-acetylmuramate-alanine ligase